MLTAIKKLLENELIDALPDSADFVGVHEDGDGSKQTFWDDGQLHIIRGDLRVVVELFAHSKGHTIIAEEEAEIAVEKVLDAHWAKNA